MHLIRRKLLKNISLVVFFPKTLTSFAFASSKSEDLTKSYGKLIKLKSYIDFLYFSSVNKKFSETLITSQVSCKQEEYHKDFKAYLKEYKKQHDRVKSSVYKGVLKKIEIHYNERELQEILVFFQSNLGKKYLRFWQSKPVFQAYGQTMKSYSKYLDKKLKI